MIEMKLLGTGNAAGFPIFGCDCSYCLEALHNEQFCRTPCSALIRVGNKQYLLDAGQVDLHKRFPPGALNGILLTHFHPDHVQGLFHLRWGKNLEIPVYTPPDSEGCADLYKHPGILSFNVLKKYQAIGLNDLQITPLPLIHSKPTFGYLIENAGKRIAYLTDTKGLPPKTQQLISEQHLDMLIVDCSYMPGYEGKGHNNLDDVIAIQKIVAAKKVILTHIGHDFDIWLRENELPNGFTAGHDGMELLL